MNTDPPPNHDSETPDDGLVEGGYWSSYWEHAGVDLPEMRGPIRDYVRQAILEELRAVVRPGDHWLEVGCASSTFLRDFPEELSARLDGLDADPAASAATQSCVDRLGIDCEIRVHDLRDISDDELHSYNGVFSYGLAEHFTDTADIHRHLAAYVKVGGFVVTVVPNLNGLPGIVQLAIDEPTYLTHNVLTPSVLSAGMSNAGIDVITSRPCIGFGLGVVNTGALRSRAARLAVNSLLVGGSRAVRLIETTVRHRLQPRLWRSPYLIAIGRTASERQSPNQRL